MNELSRFASPRESHAIGHNWRHGRQAQWRSEVHNNTVGQLVNAVNKLGQPAPMASSGMHPFKIYQLPPQYRTNPSATDWLKFRCRNGLVTWRPTVVPTALIGTPTDTWEVQNTQCVYANAPNPSQGGIPTAYFSQNDSSPFYLPFHDDDEVYLVNGGDPDYEITIPAGVLPGNQSFTQAFFWVSIDQDGDGNSYAAIHFGGLWFDNSTPTTYYGDTLPFTFVGQIAPKLTNILSNIYLLGSVYINFGNTVPQRYYGVPYICQFVDWHLQSIPNNYMNFAGTYSDDVIYYTGDVVYFEPTNSPSSGDQAVYWYIQLNALGLIDTRSLTSHGTSAKPPSGDGTQNGTWWPLANLTVP